VLAGIGPVLGGWLIDHASWRWAFWINLPLAALTVALLFAGVPESRDAESPRGLDWPGAFFVTIGLAAIVYGLLQSGGDASALWGHSSVIAGGFATLGLFLWVESRSSAPMMPLALFRSATFSGVNLLTLLLYAALSGALFFLPFKLIQVDGYSPTSAGGALLPFIVILSVLSERSGRLAGRVGARMPLIVGPVIAALGFALFALLAGQKNYWLGVFPAVALLGLGMVTCIPALTTAVMDSAPAHLAGTASAINNSASRIAGLLAIALFGIALLSGFSASLDRRLASASITEPVRAAVVAGKEKLAAAATPSIATSAERIQTHAAIDGAFLDGYRLVMLIGAGLAAASSLVAWRTVAPAAHLRRA
jgi:MFS family permease